MCIVQSNLVSKMDRMSLHKVRHVSKVPTFLIRFFHILYSVYFIVIFSTISLKLSLLRAIWKLGPISLTKLSLKILKFLLGIIISTSRHKDCLLCQRFFPNLFLGHKNGISDKWVVEIAYCNKKHDKSPPWKMTDKHFAK